MGRGKLITFEGIDGSGKTSVAKRVTRELKKKGFKVVYTCEPTSTWLGDAVKSSYEKKVSPFTELFLFLADRATHTAKIKEWMEKGFVVICDRYADSTYAYQAVLLRKYLRKLDVEPVEWLKAISRPFVLVPNLTVLLLIEPSIALKRIRRKGTKFEKKLFLGEVHGVYQKLAEFDPRFVIIDASPPMEEVVLRCLDAVLSRLLS